MNKTPQDDSDQASTATDDEYRFIESNQQEQRYRCAAERTPDMIASE